MNPVETKDSRFISKFKNKEVKEYFNGPTFPSILNSSIESNQSRKKV
jgi:hypothetical protein